MIEYVYELIQNTPVEIAWVVGFLMAMGISQLMDITVDAIIYARERRAEIEESAE